METDNFIKDHLWIAFLGVLLFTAFVAYILNKNSDPDDQFDDDEDTWENEQPKNNTDYEN